MHNNNGSGSRSGMGGEACYVYPDAPATPGEVIPDVTVNRGIYMNGTITMDDGSEITIWGFTDEDEGMGSAVTFPSPAIRVTQGQIVHTKLTVNGMMWLHTIHHHGIEPSTENDGVGHYSFDVDGTYIYQWRASHAGTYFYHCHTNTVLHTEMGMYGALIIDPVEGWGTLYSGGPVYDLEVIWAADEIDSSWHTLNWSAGTCGQDVGFNRLTPDYFIITGVDGAQSARTVPGVAVNMSVGQKLLVRYICAGYLAQRITFGGLSATIYMSDGRPLPNPVEVKSIDAVSAERYDCIITAEKVGVYDVEIKFFDQISNDLVGIATTRITVSW